MTNAVTAKLKYLRATPRKVRLVADLIRGLPVSEAEVQLFSLPKRAAAVILKLLRSALANAKNNYQLEAGKLFIKELRVDEGPRLKRWLPRARGSLGSIHKKMSHISITLAESAEKGRVIYEFVKPLKNGKKESKFKQTKKSASDFKKSLVKKTQEPQKTSSKIPAQKDELKKSFFRRKSV